MSKRWKRVGAAVGMVMLAWGVLVVLYDHDVIENDYEIRRTPEDVYDFMIDMRNEAKWNPDLVSMEKTTDAPPGVGTHFRAQWKGSPVIDVTCTHAERPSRIEFDNGGPFAVELDVNLSPSALGTKVHSRMRVRPIGAARLIFPIFVQLVRHEEKGVPLNITRALERAQPPSDGH